MGYDVDLVDPQATSGPRWSAARCAGIGDFLGGHERSDGPGPDAAGPESRRAVRRYRPAGAEAWPSRRARAGAHVYATGRSSRASGGSEARPRRGRSRTPATTRRWTGPSGTRGRTVVTDARGPRRRGRPWCGAPRRSRAGLRGAGSTTCSAATAVHGGGTSARIGHRRHWLASGGSPPCRGAPRRHRQLRQDRHDRGHVVAGPLNYLGEDCKITARLGRRRQALSRRDDRRHGRATRRRLPDDGVGGSCTTTWSRPTCRASSPASPPSGGASSREVTSPSASRLAELRRSEADAGATSWRSPSRDVGGRRRGTKTWTPGFAISESPAYVARRADARPATGPASRGLPLGR